MGKTGSPKVVLDAGALIAFERGSSKMRALCRQALQTGATLVIPAGVLAQVWRNGARQVPLRALLNAPVTRIVVLDEVMAKGVGELCAKVGTADVVDASVVLAARLERAVVVTSDASDLRRLDPRLAVQGV